MALGDRGGALEDSVSDEEEETTTDEETDTAFRGRTGETSGQGMDTTTPDADDDDDDTAFRGRTGETSGRDDDDAPTPIERTESGGDRTPQTSEPPEDGDEPMPVEQEVERGDMPLQTGPTGPTEEEGLEETGETVEQGVEETGQPKPEPSGPTANIRGGVSPGDIREALERGQTIPNIEDRPAVASVLAQMGATDVRSADVPGAVDVDLTPQGFETRVGERELAQQLEQRVIEETGLGEEDVAVQGSAEEGFEAEVSERELAQQVEQQIIEETGATEEDVAVTGSVEEGFTVVATQEAQEAQRAQQIEELGQQARRQQDIEQLAGASLDLTITDSDTAEEVQRGVARDFGRRIEQERLSEFVESVEEKTGFDVPGEGPLATERRVRFDTKEALPGEEAARQFEREAVGAGTELGEFIFGEPGTEATSGGEAVLDIAGREELGDRYTENLRNVGIGITQGVGALAGKGATIGYDITEFGLEAKDEPVESFKELGPATTEAAVMGASAAARKPARTAGSALGSAALSGGLFKVTRGRPIAGRASRVALQPGEELVKTGVSRGVLPTSLAKVTPGVRRGQMGFESETTTVKEFLESERGQSSFGLGKTREVETEDVTKITGEDLDIERATEPSIRPRRNEAPDIEAGGPLQTRRARIQRGETETSGTGRMGDPIRRQSSRVESEMEKMRKAAQKEEVSVESEIESEMEDLSVPVGRGAAFGGVAGMVERLEAAQEPEVKLDSGLESLLSQEGKLGAESDLLPDLESELALEGEQELAQELEQELESAFESEFESEFEAEFETEIEQEFESEIELELEQEMESEAEVFPEETPDEEERRRTTIGLGEDLFGTGIADVDELLREG